MEPEAKPHPKRRGVSLATKLDEALADAAALSKKPKKSYGDDTLVPRIELVQTRINALRQLLSRKHADKVERLESEIEKLASVIAALKGENQRLVGELTAARAAKPTASSQIEQAHAVLAQFAREKQTGGGQ